MLIEAISPAAAAAGNPAVLENNRSCVLEEEDVHLQQKNLNISPNQ